MKKCLIAATLCCLLALSACNERPKETPPATEAPVPEKQSFEEFAAQFPEGKLPMLLPPAEGTRDTVFSGEAVQTFFGGKLTPAFAGEEGTVPAPAECCEGISYAPVARLKQEGQFTALVLYKQQNGVTQEAPSRYYYLGVFSPKGEYVSGMCVALRDGKLERTATLNEDFSLQIQQTQTGAKDAPVENGFYEISPEGRIQGINL